jgi:hypothetical protein
MNRQITNHRLKAGVARRFMSREFESYLPHDPGSVPLEMDWHGYWGEGAFKLVIETAGNARL